MAVRVWLDKDGKVLVSPEGNVYLSEECCCAKEPDPTICWQLYSATVTTSEDGSSKGWSEPWMVDYTCLVSGSEPPGAAEWRYAQAGATRWVSFLGMCSECSVPHGADKPGLNAQCVITMKTYHYAPSYVRYYLYPATVVTYKVERDVDGVSVGQEQVGFTVIPSWELTALTPDDTDDFRYSQILGVSAKSIALPMWSKGEPPYAVLSTVVSNAYTQYDSCSYPFFPLGNGVSLQRAYGNQWFPYMYATGGQGVMSLSLVGSRYSAVPLQSTAEVTSVTTIGRAYHTYDMLFSHTDWGHVECFWELYGDPWYSSFIHMTEYRTARGGMTPLSECYTYVGSLDTYVSQDSAPGWLHRFAVEYDIPMAQAADRALSQVFNGEPTFLSAYVRLTGVQCRTWWYRLLGMAWDGCPRDQVIFDGWTTLWSREDTPEYMYLDTLVPMTVSRRAPFGMSVGAYLYHEDDDALAAGSTVMRYFSSALGDGHAYKVSMLDIHNFPSWRTDLCSTALIPVTAEVPNLIWRQTDYLLSQLEPWPTRNSYISVMAGAGWWTQQNSVAALYSFAQVTYFTSGESPDVPITVYDKGDTLYTSQYYTWYDIIGTPHSALLNAGVVFTDIGDDHKPGATVRVEALVQGRVSYYSSVVSVGKNDAFYATVTRSSQYDHAYYTKTAGVALLDGNVPANWKSYFGPNITEAYINLGIPNLEWCRLWMLDTMVTTCIDGALSSTVSDDFSVPGMPRHMERAFSANPHLPRDWYQWSTHYTKAGYMFTISASAADALTSLQRGSYTSAYSDVGESYHTTGYVSALYENSVAIEASAANVTVSSNLFVSGIYISYVTALKREYERVLLSAYSTGRHTYIDGTTGIKDYTDICTVDCLYTTSFYSSALRFRLSRNAISSGGYAPDIDVYSFITYLESDPVVKETYTRWHESTYIYKDEYKESAWVEYGTRDCQLRAVFSSSYASPCFPLRTLGGFTDPIGYVKGSVIAEPGKATIITTVGSYYDFDIEGTFMGGATEMCEVTKSGEVHVTRDND